MNNTVALTTITFNYLTVSNGCIVMERSVAAFACQFS